MREIPNLNGLGEKLRCRNSLLAPETVSELQQRSQPASIMRQNHARAQRNGNFPVTSLYSLITS